MLSENLEAKICIEIEVGKPITLQYIILKKYKDKNIFYTSPICVTQSAI